MTPTGAVCSVDRRAGGTNTRTPTTDTTSSPPHHASTHQPWWPIGVPISRPRSVSITGVTGWWRATPCSHDGSVSTGTNAELR